MIAFVLNLGALLHFGALPRGSVRNQGLSIVLLLLVGLGIWAQFAAAVPKVASTCSAAKLSSAGIDDGSVADRWTTSK